MKYTLRFQYRHPDQERPDEDTIQYEEKVLKNGEMPLLPAVGDSVEFLNQGLLGKVEFRHFRYLEDLCSINIVVTDISPDEMAWRIKE